MTRSTWMVAGGIAVALVAGCDDRIDLDPLDDAPPVEARIRPKPISGGTLLLTADRHAVASDPDRDLVHIVDLDAAAVQSTIALLPGDEPGRAIEGEGGLVHVVLRGTGSVATIDLAAGEVVSRWWLCPDPRGIARDPADGTLHVACADGALLQLDAGSGEVLARTDLEPDLRDVVVHDGEVLASVFRAATLVGADGAGDRLLRVESSHVAWRTWTESTAFGDDPAIVMLHQTASLDEVPIEVDDALEGGASPYGGGGHCQPGLVMPTLTIVRGDGITQLSVANANLTVDAAISPDGQWVALATPGKPSERSSLEVIPIGQRCAFGDDSVPTLAGQGQITAVAYTPSGILVAQSREPARVMVLGDAPHGTPTIIELEGESRLDTGHEIFHRATESTLSCASCHPEGGDDGHVWRFEGIGPRRSQALDIGLAGTEPFHWDGDMQDLDMIMGEVLAHRMGGHRQSKARRESFARWMFEQERPVANAARDDASLVAQGEALFTAYACGRCHSGPKLGGGNTESFRGQDLQVPILRRISLRPPYMHDGRSATLQDAVRDMLEGTGTTDAPQADIDAMTAYLRTL